MRCYITQNTSPSLYPKVATLSSTMFNARSRLSRIAPKEQTTSFRISLSSTKISDLQSDFQICNHVSLEFSLCVLLKKVHFPRPEIKRKIKRKKKKKKKESAFDLSFKLRLPQSSRCGPYSALTMRRLLTT